MIAKLFVIAVIALFVLNTLRLTGDSLAQSATVGADSSLDEFRKWAQAYGKFYDSHDMYTYRKAVFQKNLEYILSENIRQRDYELSPNQFMDLSPEEFKALYLTLRQDSKKTAETDRSGQRLADEPATEKTENPLPIDWRQKGVVTGVRDQGFCGACYAFSAVGNLEALNALAGNQLTDFSPQQIVDCTFPYGNYGCNGGEMDNSLQYVINRGIATEQVYPYIQKYSGKCQEEGGNFKIQSIFDVRFGDCNQLREQLYAQPMTAGVDASNWQFYSGGIFSNCNQQINHGVLLIGMSDLYWIVKNSWGLQWGESGYIRLKFGNTCGICNMASTGKNYLNKEEDLVQPKIE